MDGIVDDDNVSMLIELRLCSVYCRYFETLASNEEEHQMNYLLPLSDVPHDHKNSSLHRHFRILTFGI